MRHSRKNDPGIYYKLLRKIRRKVRSFSRIPIRYTYENFSINLPSYHLLPTYQDAHPKYDRFLPLLAEYILEMEVVVDVGANVGDTLAGMAEKNSKAKYICIEPDNHFFYCLERNVEIIRASLKHLNVRLVKELIGKNISGVTLCGDGGTKYAVIENNGRIKSVQLDEILSDEIDVRLIKSDVDGFDYDVLDSSTATIEKHKPMLFFECQCDFDYQKASYAKTLEGLQLSGYRDWVVFDNYGEMILRTSSAGVVLQLMDYSWRQRIGKTAQTIPYYDILTVQSNETAVIDEVLKRYNYNQDS